MNPSTEDAFRGQTPSSLILQSLRAQTLLRASRQVLGIKRSEH